MNIHGTIDPTNPLNILTSYVMNFIQQLDLSPIQRYRFSIPNCCDTQNRILKYNPKQNTGKKRVDKECTSLS